jgi:hypothetical protein
VKTGNEILRGYQIGGTSSTRTVPLWDLFLTSKIADAEILEEGFDQNPPGYKRDDKHLVIHCQL